MSYCDNCKLRMDTWGEKLKEEGYNGCGILLCAVSEGRYGNLYHIAEMIEERPDSIFGYIKTNEDIHTGWICNGGGMAYNNQVIVRNVISCDIFIEK